MTKQVDSDKSLLEQILEATFDSLRGRKEFDEETLQKLAELAAKGDITRETQIIIKIRLESWTKYDGSEGELIGCFHKVRLPRYLVDSTTT